MSDYIPRLLINIPKAANYGTYYYIRLTAFFPGQPG